ncbi:alanine:cation symporter family protein [Ornithinimicrobium faecis]|uniref:Alanine:cation symporter family protein n=1 Tax=Ornithinimicrobium faecis TaxID=2934158 RepID=A0ABY4YQ94_9MICO|nr:alanine/glycine:cation symporter family protein [Ornithinimicrobium sp. HY1793]USQ78939.1 alanine:cation symporter family protein [Ornithinimicrobium sp. HY1793]
MNPAIVPKLQETVESTGFLADIEKAINDVFKPIQEFAAQVVFFQIPGWSDGPPFVVLWLLVGAVICTVYFGFVQARGIATSFDVVRGKFSSPDDPGEVTHFQALASALSGTVGLGNIAGVAIAVTIGGPGATFWMILAGLLGMATKFAECTLGVKYREINEDGTVSGGPFKYLLVAYGKINGHVAKIMTGIYAVAILFFGVAGGNMFQANQTYVQITEVTGKEDSFLAGDGASLIFGLVLAGLVALVIIGGIRSIARVTDKLVPAMGTLYVVCCLTVLLVNASHIPSAITGIFEGAFNPQGVAGGVIGVMIVGMQRAAFSNEAGLGSAAIAHSAVKTRRPVSEGFVALLEPFVDTVIVCTMTALTIVVADTSLFETSRAQAAAGEEPDASGVLLTSDAFESVVSWFPILLAVAVALFAFSTLITWSYYGQKAWEYLFGRARASIVIYKTVFCVFTVMGCVLTLGEVVAFADSFLFVCAFVNILGLYLLLPVIKSEMKEYLADRKSGELLKLGSN